MFHIPHRFSCMRTPSSKDMSKLYDVSRVLGSWTLSYSYFQFHHMQTKVVVTSTVSTQVPNFHTCNLYNVT